MKEPRDLEENIRSLSCHKQKTSTKNKLQVDKSHAKEKIDENVTTKEN
jgi:hypothetical protein